MHDDPTPSWHVPIASGILPYKAAVQNLLQQSFPEFELPHIDEQLFLNNIEDSFSDYDNDGLRFRFGYNKNQYSCYMGVRREGEGFTLKLRAYIHAYDRVKFAFEASVPVQTTSGIVEAARDLFQRFMRDRVVHDGDHGNPQQAGA